MASTHARVVAERKLLVMPQRSDIANLLGNNAKSFRHNGRSLLAVPHDASVVKLLRNVGVEAPAPILSYYNWAGDTPFESQKVTAAVLSMNSRAYVLSSMGVGKTRAALYAAHYLQSIGAAKKVLVVAPLSTLVPVWEREIFGTFEGMNSVVLHGTKKQRLLRLREPSDIYIINHDGVKVLANELAKKRFDIVIVDELAAYRNRRTERWKVLKPIIENSKFAWGLTGSPTPNDPTDAYGQIKLLTPWNAPTSFRGFQQKTMKQITTFKWVPRREANDVVFAAMQPAVRFSLDECHDLPPITHSFRDIDPNAAQKKAYQQLMDEFVLDLKAERLKVVNEGARLNKLLQVGCGFAYNEVGKGQYLDASGRLKLTLEIIEEADGKVIVFAPFKFAVKMLEKVISKRYSVAAITGETPKSERDRIFTEFTQSKHPHVIVAHPGCMSHGLTLVQANTIIWYSPTHSAETYSQANARIHRPGQTRHTHIVHIQSLDIERRVYKRLAHRQKVQGVLLDMFRKQEADNG